MTGTEIENKASLRQTLLDRRGAQSESEIAHASRQLCGQLERLIFDRLKLQPQIASLFAAVKNELSLAPLAATMRGRGIEVAYPRVIAQNAPLTLHIVAAESQLVPARFGIFEPAPGAPAIPFFDVDLIVVPGLAFDHTGYRIGYGAGYYDRTLQQPGNALRIGICHDEFIVSLLPRSPWDEPVDWVVTPTKTIETRSQLSPMEAHQ